MTAGGVSIKYVETVSVLKNKFNCVQDESAEIARRTGCAHAATHEIRPHLQSKLAATECKVSLLSAKVAASMAWGIEGHLLTCPMLYQLDAVYTSIAASHLQKKFHGQ
eukprot:3194156-Karenia_brevis.AAC.1